jgi:hypothetical protein
MHLIFTAILALILYPLFGPWVAIMFLSGWLIDADHFVWWIGTRKNLNFKEFWHYHEVEAPKDNYRADDGDLYLGHTVEFLGIVMFASIFHPVALLFLIGLIGHYLLDAIWLATVPGRIVLDHSLLHWILVNWVRKEGKKKSY